MRYLLAAAAALLFLLTPALGTSVKPLTFDELVRDADRIFIGTVKELTVRPNPDDEIIDIWTDVRFTKVRMLKGPPADELTLSHAGGRLGDREIRVTGMPKLAKGRRYVLFLDPEKCPCPFLGWEQGVLRIVDRPDYPDHLVATEAGKPLREIRGGRLVPVPAEKKRKRARRKEPADDGTRLTVSDLASAIETRVRRHEAERREAEAGETAEGKGEER